MSVSPPAALSAGTALADAEARDFDLGLIKLRVEGEPRLLDGICRAGVRATATSAHAEADYRVLVDTPDVAAFKPKTDRAKRLSQGYYFLHHHGGPVALDRRSRELFSLRGDADGLNQTLFPLVTKLLLMEQAAKAGLLLLKAAVIELEGRPTLIVGPKGSGKTTLIKALRERGVDLAFVSNSVAWTDGERLYGVPAKLNVRADQAASLNVEWESAGTRCGSVLVRPEALFDRVLPSVPLAGLRVIFLSGRRGDTLRRDPLETRDAAALLSTFAVASNVYGMARDLWDAADDTSDFLRVLHRQSVLVDALAARGTSHSVSIDSLAHAQVDALLGSLSRD